MNTFQWCVYICTLVFLNYLMPLMSSKKKPVFITQSLESLWQNVVISWAEFPNTYFFYLTNLRKGCHCRSCIRKYKQIQIFIWPCKKCNPTSNINTCNFKSVLSSFLTLLLLFNLWDGTVLELGLFDHSSATTKLSVIFKNWGFMVLFVK